MDVRDERRRQPAQGLRDVRNTAPQVEDALAQDGVGQQPYAVQLDQDGRVPDVDEPCGCRYAVPAASRLYAHSAAITSTSSAMISTAQTGW